MSQQQNSFLRFSLAQRIEHIILIASFTTLALTGLVQKYPFNPISQGAIRLLGGIEVVRFIHHTAAVVFLLETVYHIVVVGYKLFVLKREASMIPTVKDGKDAIQMFLYNLNFTRKHPKMPRYNFTEKMEYWAMLWGMVIMSVTGFMLWNPIATTNVLPGEIIPAAKTAHGGEAVLAVLAILIWHFYHVHIRRFNKSMFTGRMDAEAMAEEHGEELERIRAGQVPPLPSPAEQRRRMKIFAPVATVVTLALLGGIYWFVTVEQTSITTLPPEQRAAVFAPQTPTPFPTPEPTPTMSQSQIAAATEAASLPVTWEARIGQMLIAECASCHGTMGGYSVESYDEAMTAVTPGDPDASPLVRIQREGGHPGQLTSNQLNQVIEWVRNNAPEQ